MVQPVSNETNKQINVLFGGREPVLRHQGYLHASSDPPSVGGDGVSVADQDGAIQAFIGLRLRKTVGRWTSWLYVHNPDAGQEFGVRVVAADGVTAYTITNGGGSADIDTILADVIDAFEAESDFTDDGGEVVRLGTSAVLEISWPEATRPTSTLIGTSGLGNTTYQSLVGEADHAMWAAWGYGRSDGRWHRLDLPYQYERADQGVRLVPVRASGFDRLAVELIDADGAVLAWAAPCYLDAQVATYQQAADQALATYEAAASWVPDDQTGARPAFDALCPTTVVEVSTTSTEVAPAGALYVEVQNRTGADLYLATGRVATADDYLLPDGESWYTPSTPLGRRWPAVHAIIGSGTGDVVVVEVR